MFITEEDLKNRLARTSTDNKVTVDNDTSLSLVIDAGQNESSIEPFALEDLDVNDSESISDFQPAAESKLESLSNSLVSNEDLDAIIFDAPDGVEIQEKNFRGKTAGAKNLPDFLRPIIGASAILSGVKETKEAFGLASTATPVHASKGKTSQYSPVNEENKAIVNKIVGDATDQIKDAAVDRMMSALNLITDDKLSKAKVKDISGVAKDMASIVDKITPKERDVTNPTQIIIYAPAQKTLSNYETVPSV